MDAEILKARTRQFALEIIDLCLALGIDDLARLVRPQLLRSGTGTATGYRAACRSRSSREFASKMATVTEEADESELWLDILQVRQRGAPAIVLKLRREATELRAIAASSRATTLRRIRTARIRKARRRREKRRQRLASTP